MPLRLAVFEVGDTQLPVNVAVRPIILEEVSWFVLNVLLLVPTAIPLSVQLKDPNAYPACGDEAVNVILSPSQMDELDGEILRIGSIGAVVVTVISLDVAGFPEMHA